MSTHTLFWTEIRKLQVFLSGIRKFCSLKNVKYIAWTCLRNGKHTETESSTYFQDDVIQYVLSK